MSRQERERYVRALHYAVIDYAVIDYAVIDRNVTLDRGDQFADWVDRRRRDSPLDVCRRVPSRRG
jgi:hypothetical protein